MLNMSFSNYLRVYLLFTFIYMYLFKSVYLDVFLFKYIYLFAVIVFLQL